MSNGKHKNRWQQRREAARSKTTQALPPDNVAELMWQEWLERSGAKGKFSALDEPVMREMFLHGMGVLILKLLRIPGRGERDESKIPDMMLSLKKICKDVGAAHVALQDERLRSDE